MGEALEVAPGVELAERDECKDLLGDRDRAEVELNAECAALGLDPASAFRVGFVPFFTGDLLKVGLAAGLIVVLGPRPRGLR